MEPERARTLLNTEIARVRALLGDERTDQRGDRAPGTGTGDVAEPSSARGVDDAVAAGLHDRLAALYRALGRVAEGTYARSVRSGAPVPDVQLEADPAAELTVEEAVAGERAAERGGRGGTPAPGRFLDRALPGRLDPLVRQLDRYQRTHPPIGFVIAVVDKFLDDHAGYLAALIAYHAFVSLFPLLLLVATILGLVLAGSPHLQHDILSSALAQVPVIGADLHTPARIGGGAIGIVVGVLGATYGALGVAQAFQYANNVVWNVPDVARPSPFRAGRRSLLLLTVMGLGVLVSGAMSTLGAAGAGSLNILLRLVALPGALLVSSAVLVFAFRIGPDRGLTVRQVWPGALTGAVLWQLLQAFGVTYINHVVKHASSTNSVFALILGLLVFLHLAAMAVIAGAEVNAVRVDRLYPRALRTSGSPAELAAGDRQLFVEQVRAQRRSGGESVQVTFAGGDPQSDAPRRDAAPG